MPSAPSGMSSFSSSGLVFFALACIASAQSNDTNIGGVADCRFQRVKELFERNFRDQLETDGAALTVFVKGEKVVDIWGGYADKESLRKWKKDTLSVIFSASKGVASLCIALLVDRGLISYDDLVTKHWPKFGQNGKENITVEMLISHKGGLSYFDEPVTVEEAMDHRSISKKIERQRPNSATFNKTTYHATTHGWLTDQLIRRVDPKKRSIGQFVRQEFHVAHNIEFYFGLPNDKAVRVARLFHANQTEVESSPDLFSDTVILIESLENAAANGTPLPLTTDAVRAMVAAPWLQFGKHITVNDPELWKIEQAAALGIGNARSLARLYNMVVRRKLISATILALMQERHAKGQLGNGDWEAGLMFNTLDRAGTKFLIGHTGLGCQQAFMDVGNEIAIGYTTNGLKEAIDECDIWRGLKNAIYDVIEEKN